MNLLVNLLSNSSIPTNFQESNECISQCSDSRLMVILLFILYPPSETISQDKAAVLAYLRLRHKDPYKGYILCGIVSINPTFT